MLKKVQSVRRKSSSQLFLLIIAAIILLFSAYLVIVGKIFPPRSISSRINLQLAYLKEDPAFVSLRISDDEKGVEIIVDSKKIPNLEVFSSHITRRIKKVIPQFELKILAADNKSPLIQKTVR